MSDSVRARAGRIRAKTVERETKPSAAAPDPSIRHRVEPDAMSRERTASPRTPAAAVMHKARRLLGRLPPGVIAWCLLPRLLLAPFRYSVPAGRYERGGDGGPYSSHLY